ncbi:MMPL family transporter [Paenibacillus abyssi]|uniref:Transporter n=1 Tax=Paenibacillus abyssi TaxID=1340531 RepID=A0A917D8V8_9BACL|nr:MMPL family transporter [Paenibacillus abyssi]GGG13534.1 transporter [Paenibacillus abyssi]
MGYHLLALISVRYAKPIILLWALFFVCFGYYAPKLPDVLKDHGLTPDGAYGEVQQILVSDFHIPEDPVLLLFEKEDHVSQEQFRRFIQTALQQLHGIEGLPQAASPLEIEGMLKENAAYALLVFKQPSYEIEPVLEEIRRRLPGSGDITVKMSGKSVVQADVNQASRHDMRQAELIGIPAAFLILWWAFGGIVSALIPIVMGIIGVTGTMGLMYGLGTKVELSNFVLNVIPMVGLALTLDFALIVVSRFREELTKSAVEPALAVTMKTAGRAVVLSAACVFLGLTGILFIPLPIFTTVALGAMAVLTVSLLLTLTLLPALLSMIWPAIQAESKPLAAGRHKVRRHSFYRYVMRRPVRMGLLASLLLIACLLPLGRMTLGIPDAASLPHGYESRRADEAYQSYFVSASVSQVHLIVQGSAYSFTKADWIKTAALIARLNRDPDVQRVDSVFSNMQMPPEQLHFLLQRPDLKRKYEPVLQRFVHGNRMLVHVTIAGAPSSKQAKDWISAWERQGETGAIRFLIGGEAKYQQEVFDAIFKHVKDVLLFVLISNFIVLFIAFRSVLIPIKIMAMNLLSLGASFGILAWIVEGGHLGMESGSIAIMIPVFIFGLVFGISMDYGVFLISRIYEVYRETQDNDQAVWMGLATTGRMITSAAAIMIAVTIPFAFGDVAGVKQLGIGIASAIFIDATIIRMILVPSLMRLLGRWNWWAP